MEEPPCYPCPCFSCREFSEYDLIPDFLEEKDIPVWFNSVRSVGQTTSGLSSVV